ncbi:hypothetical protein BWZ20_07890 [Winogradskyella sp. J14-2]|uniref:hypothetical protein n=1 Tax=Winogradskyella sp. J14-2 TaxID=1936080 RepID=UPI0009729793|nr:hypothetical protein [Winogradskyella sp. J14-2]APY08227.1 hypothetical protein BWZ20_07890 [Winogradskyella sp. J14-2]
MKLKPLLFSMLFLVCILACEDDDENTNGTGVINFSLIELVEVENATSSLTLNIGIDNFNHSGGIIDVSITGGNYGVDYETSQGSSNFALEVEPQSLVSTFSINPIDDDVIEDDVVLIITITAASGALELGEQTTLTFTILDNDNPLIAMVGFENETDQIEEDSSNPLTINIPFNQATTDGGTISVSSSGDAAFGTDYSINGQIVSNFDITVPTGATSASFEVVAINNGDFEADKSVIFELTEVSGGLSLGAVTQTTVTIINDDSPPNPVIDFSAGNTLVYDESAGTVTLNFDLSDATTADATVELTATGTADSNDYTFQGVASSPYSFTILAGSTSASITLDIEDDADTEVDETIVLDITNVTGGLDAGLDLQQQTLTITDNDAVVFNYTETFESNDGTDTYLTDVLQFESFSLSTQTLPDTEVLSLITNAGSFTDVNDVSGTSDNGLNIFYNAQSNAAGNGQLDNVLITPILQGSGLMDVTVDGAYAFKNQNPASITFYWSQAYDGSGTFNESDWTIMGTETVANMDGEGFGNNDYKRQEFTIDPSADFYVAIRVTGTVTDDDYRLRWRFDNISVNSQ